MSLYDSASKIKPVARKAAAQLTKTVFIDINRLPQLAEAVEAAYPEAVINENAIRNGGLTAAKKAVCPFAAKVERTPAHGSGQVTVYHNGKVVLTGVMTGLDFA